MAKGLEPMDRTIHFSSGVDQGSIHSVITKIININEDDQKLKKEAKRLGFKYTPKPIKLYVNSYGGEVYQGFALVDVMNASKTPIHTYGIGAAMSCGFLILVHGHRRFMYEHTGLMYHQISSGSFGTAKAMDERTKQVKDLYKLWIKAIAAKTNISKKKLKRNYKRKQDWFLTPEEALKLNVVDEIVTSIV